MSIEDQSPKRSLSEISHLFLSSVREKQTAGAPLPRRIPPGAPRPLPQVPPPPTPGGLLASNMSVDLTPEEMEEVFAGAKASAEKISAPDAPRRTPPVTAVLATHLGANAADRVRDYAGQLAASEGRIGLIMMDGGALRLSCIEADHLGEFSEEQAPEAQTHENDEVIEALEEMNWDVDRWLVFLPNPRTSEARALLRGIAHWALLSTCDHDGVVASYRLLKGLAESNRPRLTLTLLDSTDEVESEKVFRKVAGVCRQFLNCNLEAEAPLGKVDGLLERMALHCHAAPDGKTTQYWDIVSDFLKSLHPPVAEEAIAENELTQEVQPMEDSMKHASFEPEMTSAFTAAPAYSAPIPPRAAPAPAMHAVTDPIPMFPAAASATSNARRDTTVEVLDLPMDGGVEAILTAILQQNRGQIVEVPLRIPMCDGARLAINRDRGMVLLAVCREGLSGLRAIGQAYRWVSENRSLIGMAIPQFAIDPNLTPELRLLVDHGDVSADMLQPILQAAHVTVQAYRKLRWGGKTGLFLEAA